MREISPENLYLSLFREHLGGTLSVTWRHTHTHTPLVADPPLCPSAVCPSSPFHPSIPSSASPTLPRSLTPLFPLTLSCSTAISLLHLAIKTSRKVEEKENSLYFQPPVPPPFYLQRCLPISNLPLFFFFIYFVQARVRN